MCIAERKRKNHFSESTGGKSLMNAESLLKEEEKLSANIRLFCMVGVENKQFSNYTIPPEQKYRSICILGPFDKKAPIILAFSYPINSPQQLAAHP